MTQKKGLLIFLFLGAVLLIFFIRKAANGDEQNISWDTFLDMVEDDYISTVRIEENLLIVFSKNRVRYETVIPPGEAEYLKLLRSKHVRIIVERSNSGWIYLLLSLLLPLGLLFLLLRGLAGRMGGQITNAANSFAKLGTKVVKPDEVKTTFADVAGAEEAKADLMEIVDHLTDPGRYAKVGARVPNGVLLIGPPGTGKTLLARATAGEAKVSFFQISGSEFVEMFVGVGAARVRELFEYARKASPCIVFIDEIDAVGRQRGAGLGQGNDEREQTLNQLLKEMDGFIGQPGIVILAATNMPQVLDRALLRPGRFDRHVIVPLPDAKAREAILRVHVKKIALDTSVDLARVAQGLPVGMSGADIMSVVNEAALFAAAQNKSAVDENNLSCARDRVIMGPARKSMILSPELRRVIAYHESGHAIVAHYTLGADPVYRITIVPHGMALGVTMTFPESDLRLKTREHLLAEIDVFFGGRVAEEIINGPDGISTGAENDLQNVTEIARSMVMRWGMSPLGERSFGSDTEHVFFGREIGTDRNFSETTAYEIDQAVDRILYNARERAQKLLLKNRSRLDALAQALLLRETVEKHELKLILDSA